jgi:hypothetical protein
MTQLLGILARTVILDDAAYQEWRERPNLFLRGIVLLLIITLIAGIVTFAVTLIDQTRAPDAAKIRESIQQGLDMQEMWNPAWDEPEVREAVDGMVNVIVPMVLEISQVEAPLPRGITGLFQALGGWLSRAMAAIGGWLAYGALVLIFVNLLGGSAKLPDFLGMVALYSIPGLLAVLQPVPCLGTILALLGTIWAIVVYMKAVSVGADLDTGRAIVAVVAPIVVVSLVIFLLGILWITWLVVIF